MNAILNFGMTHAGLSTRLLLLVILPWIWAVAWVPAWVSAGAAGVSLVAWMLLLSLAAGAGGESERDAGSDGAPFAKWRQRKRVLQQVVVELNALTDHWQRAGRECQQAISSADGVLQHAMNATASAVTDIGSGFNEIVSKTQQQTNIARQVLMGGNAEDARHSLAAHLSGYEQSLQRLAGEVQRFSTDMAQVVEHQRRIAGSVRGLADFNDELHDLASQISRIALDGSVAMTSQTHGPDVFIAMTDRIRGISEEAHQLTRRIRQGLDSAAEEVKSTSRMTVRAAGLVQTAAQSAQNEVGQLVAETSARSQRIEDAIRQINVIGESISTDINKIIVAIQFQDITHQQLAAMRTSVLGGASETLQRLAAESDALLCKERTRAARAYAERALLNEAPGAEPAATGRLT